MNGRDISSYDTYTIQTPDTEAWEISIDAEFILCWRAPDSPIYEKTYTHNQWQETITTKAFTRTWVHIWRSIKKNLLIFKDVFVRELVHVPATLMNAPGNCMEFNLIRNDELWVGDENFGLAYERTKYFEAEVDLYYMAAETDPNHDFATYEVGLHRYMCWLNEYWELDKLYGECDSDAVVYKICKENRQEWDDCILLRQFDVYRID